MVRFANMRIQTSFYLLLATLISLPAAEPIPNRLIDYPGFRRIVGYAEATREQHRLTEMQFLEAMSKPGAVLLDARSASMFALLHIWGAVSLPFTDFTAENLARVIPSKTSSILIYCNNNFADSPVAFAAKTATASLNLSTYTSLRAYGYENIFELGPLLKVKTTAIPFAGLEVQDAAARH